MNNAAEIMKGYSPEIMCPVNFFQNIQDPNDIDWNDCSAHKKKQKTNRERDPFAVSHTDWIQLAYLCSIRLNAISSSVWLHWNVKLLLL